MKSKSACVSHIILSVMSVGCLIITMALTSNASSKIEPVGTNIGPVRFDAIIELNRYSPDSLRQDYTMIFTRYWVARDYYSAAILWVEPQSTDLFFAPNLPSLSFASGEKEFIVRHESNKKYNETYKKPLGERGVFRHKFGSYPINNIRFTEKEALAERIYTDDLEVLEDSNQTDVKELDLSILSAEGGEEIRETYPN
jgi:hypothetical protein